MARRLLAWTVLGILLTSASPALAKAGGEWAKGVPYHVSYEDAIKEAKESGRILLIYNGWERAGI